ncbi:heavy-metal-associated domain-containing protein [Allostreptomyces psammosilenae]|uniref:Copper chaperone CopZ n=1 Tax=Allostreptomyces psammosilenae TaxID=1892865 RepID=A0A853A0P1_9ACTN|nr:heavy-metal-associated domain-containing protein [Allostreptomyces psammosilenae]NYI08183.1 copper chaperone CopZ [Allostreptomyces psammosilenae]
MSSTAETTTYRIEGMTCGHCANAVTTELSALDAVATVEVDVAAGTATVTSSGPLPEQAVREAVDEAGYTLVGTV